MGSHQGRPVRASAVLVDCGRVLIHPDDALFQQAARMLGCVLPDGIATKALGRTVWEGSTSPDPVAFWNGPAKIDAWARHAALSNQDGHAVWTRVHQLDSNGIRLWSRPDPGAGTALHRLTEAGLPVAIVSNNDGRLHQQLTDAGLAHHVTAFIDSAAVGVAKPAPGIFAYAAAQLGVRIDQCIMIGDDPYFDINASLRAGVATAVLIDPGTDRPAAWPGHAYPDLSAAVETIISAVH